MDFINIVALCNLLITQTRALSRTKSQNFWLQTENMTRKPKPDPRKEKPKHGPHSKRSTWESFLHQNKQTFVSLTEETKVNLTAAVMKPKIGPKY